MSLVHPFRRHSTLSTSLATSKPSLQSLKLPSSRTAVPAPRRRATGLEGTRRPLTGFEESSERSALRDERKDEDFRELCKRRGKVVMPLRLV